MLTQFAKKSMAPTAFMPAMDQLLATHGDVPDSIQRIHDKDWFGQ